MLVVAKDDFMRREVVFLQKKILLDGCSSAGVKNCLVHVIVQVGELAGRDLMFPVHKFHITKTVSDEIAARCFLFS